ncbi:type IV secretion system protein, partial [Burkholderia mallei]
NGTNGASGAELDRLSSQLVDFVNKNQKSVGSFDVAGKIEVVIQNAVVIISFGLFLVIAGAFILLAKVMLAILAVLGPLFIP